MRTTVALREDQIRRYARHVLLPDVGGRGQERILGASVAVEVGPGRHAEIAALAYLAAAGVGRLVVTGDVEGPATDEEIAAGILYGAADAGRPRLQALRRRIEAINPDAILVTEAAPGTVSLAQELEPGSGSGSGPAVSAGTLIADAMVRGGAAAVRVLTRIARRSK